jgi:hypothetical protein
MPWYLKSEGGQVLVVRDRDKKVVGRHANRKKATAQLKVLYSLEKAQFRSFIEKASFGGDRSAAGRYAAEQRWKGHKKEETSGSKPIKDAIVESFPLMMKVNSVPWAKGDSSHFEMLVEEGVSEKSAKLATSDNVTLGDYADPAVAAGNCGIASADVGAFLIRAGIAKDGEVFMREVGEPAYGDMGGTHFVTHIGPKDSPDAIIVDFTLRQFDSDADFPWVGTVQQYRETGYETDDIVGPELGTDMDPIDASGNVLYPGYEKLTSK